MYVPILEGEYCPRPEYETCVGKHCKYYGKNGCKIYSKMKKMRAFKVEPGEQKAIGCHIDSILNSKGMGQWYSIMELEGKRVLFMVTAPDPECQEENHLSDRKHGESDQT